MILYKYLLLGAILFLSGCIANSNVLTEEELLPEERDGYEEPKNTKLWRWLYRMKTNTHSLQHYHIVRDGKLYHIIDVRICIDPKKKKSRLQKNYLGYRLQKEDRQLSFYVERCHGV